MFYDCISWQRCWRRTASDIAIGPVADDDVYGTIILYEQGFLDKETAIKRLKVRKLYNQILFHTEKSLQFCRYIKCESIGGCD